MRTPASIGSHPIHPMLIPFPFALWFFSLVADIIYYATDRAIWEDVAFYTLAGGIVGAVIAAVPGFIDYLSIRDERVNSIANWHARLNVIALLVFAASFYLRTTDGMRMINRNMMIPLLLSVLGVILIMISGWLGGSMVYKHGIAVEPQPEARTTEETRPRRVA
ncbi:MAG TPA: DUF2231 domain-containing protein [Blastocatellia bacterium]|nr:DUF2231 domain-containing protein [Blastocatellia bacterium]